jgi:hypothetical protein
VAKIKWVEGRGERRVVEKACCPVVDKRGNEYNETGTEGKA